MYLLDTDHLSILLWKNEPDYTLLQRRISACSPNAIFVSIVSFHEQFMGWNAYLQRGRTSRDTVRGYEMMAKVINNFAAMQIAPFDGNAAAVFDRLRPLRVGVMDLRIAATALARNLVVLTKNSSDFSQVPSLRIEDWTLPLAEEAP